MATTSASTRSSNISWDAPSATNSPIVESIIHAVPSERANNKSWLQNIRQAASKTMQTANGVMTAASIRFGEQDLNAPIGEAFANSGCPFVSLNIGLKKFNVTRDPTAIKAILKPNRNNRETFTVADQAPVLELLKKLFAGHNVEADDFFLTCSAEYNKEYRRLISQYMSRQEGKEENIKKLVQSELNTYSVLARNGEALNVATICQRYSSSVISHLFLGHPGPYEDICNAINTCMKEASKTLTGVAPSDAEFDDARKIIAEAIGYVKNAEDASFIQDIKESDIFIKKPIRWDILIFGLFTAGQETTSTMLTFLIYELAKNQEVQSKLRQEVRNSDDITTSVYLKKCIKEALRMYPPFGGIGRHLASTCELINKFADGTEEFRQAFKEDYAVASLFFLGRDSNRWENPNVFNPDRWEDGREEFPNYAFGYSVHGCLGRKLALMESYHFIKELVRRFEITIDPNVNIHPIQQQTLKPNKPIFVNLKEYT